MRPKTTITNLDWHICISSACEPMTRHPGRFLMWHPPNLITCQICDNFILSMPVRSREWVRVWGEEWSFRTDSIVCGGGTIVPNTTKMIMYGGINMNGSMLREREREAGTLRRFLNFIHSTGRCMLALRHQEWTMDRSDRRCPVKGWSWTTLWASSGDCGLWYLVCDRRNRRGRYRSRQHPCSQRHYHDLVTKWWIYKHLRSECNGTSCRRGQGGPCSRGYCWYRHWLCGRGRSTKSCKKRGKGTYSLVVFVRLDLWWQSLWFESCSERGTSFWLQVLLLKGFPHPDPIQMNNFAATSPGLKFVCNNFFRSVPSVRMNKAHFLNFLFQATTQSLCVHDDIGLGKLKIRVVV